MLGTSGEYAHYHAHVYFDETSLELAYELRDEVYKELGLWVENFNTHLVGPHPKWSFEIVFTLKEFDTLLPWIDDKRAGLSVLIHPLTQNELKDHTELAHWLGEPLALTLSVFW